MSRAKGNRTKRKAREHYELYGWIVDDCEKTNRYAKNKDLFNLFDLVAIKGTQVCFIQCKTNRPATQKLYKNWAGEHCNEFIRCEVYTWYDNDGPRIQNYTPDGKIEELDLRNSKNEGSYIYKEKMEQSELEEKRQVI